MTSTSQRNAAGNEEKFARITDAGLRHSLLRRLIHERLFVSVILPRRKERYNSTVLDMEADGSLLLDELYPEEGQQLLYEGGTLRVYARLDRQAALYFDSRVRAVDEEEGMRIYRLEPPSELHYLQRRSDFRVQVQRVEYIPVTLRCREGSTLEGALHDLSSGGASVLLDEGSGAPPEEGEVLDRCLLQPLDEAALSLRADVRRVTEGPEKGRMMIGLRFHINEPRDKQRLDRLVHRLERQLLRHRYPM